MIKNVLSEIPLCEQADMVFMFVTGPSIDNVFDKSRLCFSQYCQYFSNLSLLSWGPVAGENTHSRNADKLFYGKFCATYHDAHRKYTHSKFEL